VLLNAAFGLTAAGRVDDPAEGLRLAAEAIDSGRAMGQLEKLAAMTND
jgi:anthranilate phosphoribosyltransferase